MAKFKTRARALDLLGRQQIAGIPTAINELLKNAHDAYADTVNIDYFRSKRLLVLRDDGLGMSKDDFESRWLTLGTESKVNHRKSNNPPIDPDKPKRISMGEKGIGRLAIASIGRQVLIITKAKGTQKVTVALINWEIFALPGLNLEDIIVPVKIFNDIPDSSDLIKMKSELLDSLKVLLQKDDISQEEYDSLTNSIQSFDISPKEFNTKLARNFSLNNINDSGTLFIISEVDEILNLDIDGNQRSSEATKIEKMLMGFHNTMTPDHPKPILDIVFRDYRNNDDSYVDLIDPDHFFSKTDFELADHHFKGTFDEYGQFKGAIKIYKDNSFDNHIVNWRSNNFKKTLCGPFEINLAYVQGTKTDSIIDADNYGRISAKADKFGGLYVYKDNIRILPYGDSDYDYLDIEKNRSKRASTYFFSYRRMFGVINISNKSNADLKEKAGREGFIENKAFRQLQDILKNFFLQLAADFFSDEKADSPKAEAWRFKRNELQAAHEALKKREKNAKERKDKFEIALTRFFKDLDSGVYDEKVEEILLQANNEAALLETIDDTDVASQKLLDIESSTRKKLNDYKKQISVASPKGFYVKGELKRQYEAYLNTIPVVDEDVFVSTSRKIDYLIEQTIKHNQLSVSKRKRLEQAVNFISEEVRQVNVNKRKDARDSANDISKRVKVLTTDLMIELDDQIREVKDKFKSIQIIDETDVDLVNQRNELSEEIYQVSERNTAILDTIIRQLEGIYWEKDENNNFVTNEQITNALGDEIDELREKAHSDIELSQLGLAVSVIHHEFSSTVRAVRSSLKDLRAWSDVNEHLEGIYKNIKISFEHLDGYLNLFTPLNRRLQRKNEDIKLLEIKAFLIDLFKSRLIRHNITFKHTKGFSRGLVTGFRSSFYPVFVNVIDNAIYWLNESEMEERIIRLHADDNGNIFISNNGIEVLPQDKNKIFDLGFTRKSNGRGMGLHISNEVLDVIGYRLELVEPRGDSTVTFKIGKKNNG